jgi:hypothetical protein
MKTKKVSKKRVVKSVSFEDVRKNVMMINIETVNREEEGRTITATELPYSIHKQRMELYVTKMSDVKLCVIAIKKIDKDWEAYVGYPDVRDLKVDYKDNANWEPYEWCCENVHDVQQVKMMGEKLSKHDAMILFPDWAVLSYFE